MAERRGAHAMCLCYKSIVQEPDQIDQIHRLESHRSSVPRSCGAKCKCRRSAQVQRLQQAFRLSPNATRNLVGVAKISSSSFR